MRTRGRRRPDARQQEMLAWCWEGLTNRQIARRMGLGPDTVREELHRAYVGLGLAGPGGRRTPAALWLWAACLREVGRP